MLKILLLIITLLLTGENAFAVSSAKEEKSIAPEQQATVQLRQGKPRALTQIPDWENLSEQEKKILRQNFKRFQRLPPKKQAKLKRLFRKYKKLPPEKKRLLLEKYRRFQHLPPAKRKRLRQQFKNMSDRQKRKFLLGE